jgi:hypothetical protein
VPSWEGEAPAEPCPQRAPEPVRAGAAPEAYGWPATLTDQQILEKLVALNAERAAEEAKGQIRWLRPEYQNAASGKGEAGSEEEQ